MSDDSLTHGTETEQDEGDIGISSAQLMLALQLGIFLPILGPLVAIAIGAMNRNTKDGRMIMLGGLGLILLQLATGILIWGYVLTHRTPVPGG